MTGEIRPVFVLVHGSWSGGDVWHRLVPVLEARGAQVLAPTLTGMDREAEPGGPGVGVATHMEDIERLLTERDLRDVVLVGHSYGGFVISGVAARQPGRVRTLVFLDAFVPAGGECLFDLLPEEARASMRAGLQDAAGRTREQGAESAWLLPVPASVAGWGVTGPDATWLEGRTVPTPVQTFEEALSQAAASEGPSVFVRCTRFGNTFEESERRARANGWPVKRLDSGHFVQLGLPCRTRWRTCWNGPTSGEARCERHCTAPVSRFSAAA